MFSVKILFATVALHFSVLNAAIVLDTTEYSFPPSGLVVWPDNSSGLPFDFNEDGQTDLFLRYYYDDFPNYVFSVAGPDSTGILNVDQMAMGGQPEVRSPLLGSDIQVGSLTTNQQDGFSYEFLTFGVHLNLTHIYDTEINETYGPFFDQTGYLGFQFSSDDGVHYGWMLIEGKGFDILPGGGRVLMTAYESVPGKAIFTGAVPEPSSTLLASIVILAGIGFRRRN